MFAKSLRANGNRMAGATWRTKRWASAMSGSSSSKMPATDTSIKNTLRPASRACSEMRNTHSMAPGQAGSAKVCMSSPTSGEIACLGNSAM